MTNTLATRVMSVFLYLAQENECSGARMCSESNLGTQHEDTDCQKKKVSLIFSVHVGLRVTTKKEKIIHNKAIFFMAMVRKISSLNIKVIAQNKILYKVFLGNVNQGT